MAKPYIDFTAVKAAVTMTQALEHYGLMPSMTLKKNGEALEGPCPIHKGDSPDQFKVSITKNCWNCFSDCKWGGNVLDFVAKMENCDAQEAAIRMNGWFKLDLDVPPCPHLITPQQTANSMREARLRSPLTTRAMALEQFKHVLLGEVAPVTIRGDRGFQLVPLIVRMRYKFSKNSKLSAISPDVTWAAGGIFVLYRRNPSRTSSMVYEL